MRCRRHHPQRVALEEEKESYMTALELTQRKRQEAKTCAPPLTHTHTGRPAPIYAAEGAPGIAYCAAAGAPGMRWCVSMLRRRAVCRARPGGDLLCADVFLVRAAPPV